MDTPQWHNVSTDEFERYELSVRRFHARGIILRPQGIQPQAGYLAYVSVQGHKRQANRFFSSLNEAQAWADQAMRMRIDLGHWYE
jgi:hypothetical protein